MDQSEEDKPANDEDEFTRNYYKRQDELSRRARATALRDDEALKHEVWSCKVGDYLELIAPIKLVSRETREPCPSPDIGRIYRVEELRGRHFWLVPVDGVPQDDIGMFNSEISDHFKVVAPPATETSGSPQT